MNSLDYLEQVLKRLIDELKEKNCLDQDFKFQTKAEREKVLERFVEDFINQK